MGSNSQIRASLRYSLLFAKRGGVIGVILFNRVAPHNIPPASGVSEAQDQYRPCITSLIPYLFLYFFFVSMLQLCYYVRQGNDDDVFEQDPGMSMTFPSSRSGVICGFVQGLRGEEEGVRRPCKKILQSATFAHS